MQPNTYPTPAQNQAAPVGAPRSVPPAQPMQPQQPGPKPPTNPNSTQNTLEIAAIRDGIVIMNDGSFRSVVMAKSINFDLMSGPEQDAVEYAYQGFLNSLYFDIQIFVRSRKIDMRPYLDRLQKIRTEMNNMLLGMLMEDYIYFIDDLVHQTNIMSKEFYIVIPYYTVASSQNLVSSGTGFFGKLLGKNSAGTITINEADLEKAKTELKNRVQNVTNGLIQIGIQAAPLDTQELIELYYNVYNPDTATRQTLKQNASQLTVPIIGKGDGHAAVSNMTGEN